jgi:cytochrome P450
MSATALFIPPHPPVPERPLPLFAFLRAIRTNAIGIWTEAAYQDDVVVRRLFGRSMMLINSPEAIHRILVDNPGNYRRSPASVRILRPLTGNGLLLSTGDDWRLQRRTIAPALAPRTLPVLAHHIVACASEAVASLLAKVNEPVDILAAMQHLALDIAGRSMFSLETQQFGAAMRRLLGEFAQRHARLRLFDMVLPAGVPTLGDIGRGRFQRRWMALIDAVVQSRLSKPSGNAPRDLFDLLVAARDPETGAGFSHEQLRDQAATLILAGHETTAVTLFWALVLLAGAPGEQERIAREVADIELDPGNAMAVMPRLAHTRAVVSETLRLYPPAFTLARQAIADDRAGAIDIPRGSVLMIAPWVLHRHRRYWRDPDAFDPTRFLPDAPQPPRFAYLPFGAGPRVCVGAQFALAEATLVLAMLMRALRVTTVDPVMPRAVVTTQPERPPMFRLSAR